MNTQQTYLQEQTLNRQEISQNVRLICNSLFIEYTLKDFDVEHDWHHDPEISGTVCGYRSEETEVTLRFSTNYQNSLKDKYHVWYMPTDKEKYFSHKTPSINFSKSKSPEKCAVDIRNRLIKEVEVFQGFMLKLAQDKIKTVNQELAFYKPLCDALGIEVAREDNAFKTIKCPQNVNHYSEFYHCSDHKVNLKGFVFSFEAAIQVFKIWREDQKLNNQES